MTVAGLAIAAVNALAALVTGVAALRALRRKGNVDGEA